MKYDFEMDLDEQSSVGKIARQIKPNSKILEFGPGNGRLTKHLIGVKNCEVSIVELDKELYDFVSEIAQDGFYGDIESFDWAKYFAGKKFDYILYADVLEHLVDPVETLKKAREFLNEDGEILITFPNLVHNSVMIHLFNNELPWTSYGLLDETHNSFYTHDGFQKVFEKAGLFVNIEDYLYLAVEDTEFSSTYEQLPAEIRYAFKVRPYGEVYQYFFSLKKYPVIESISEPQNSSYVHVMKITQKTNERQNIQQIPFNSFTGENETITLPVVEGVQTVVFHFDEQPSFIEFNLEKDGEKIEFIHSNAIIKTKNDCYLFDGTEVPEFCLTGFLGKELTIHCHYRFIGELPETMKELLEMIKPMAEVQQQLMEKVNSLEKEIHRLRTKNLKLDHYLQTTITRYYSLIKKEKWLIQPRKRSDRLKETSKKIQSKELSLCVDEKNWNPQTKILTITGWGVSMQDRRPLSYKLSENQSPFISVNPIHRAEVNQAEQLSEDVDAGFELQILCEKEQEFLIEVESENGQTWFVKM